MTANNFRRLALSLPEVAEAAPEQQELFVRAEPKSFVPVKGGWGKAGNTNVRLRAARRAAVREALITAWRNRAPQATGTGPGVGVTVPPNPRLKLRR